MKTSLEKMNMMKFQNSSIPASFAANCVPLLSWENFAGLLPLVFFLPTLVFDLLIFTVLSRSFKTPFYTLLAYSLVWDILTWISFYIMFRGSSTPLYFSIYDLIPQKGWIPTALLFINAYNSYVQWFLSYMLTANRFIFCLYPINYEKIWNKIFHHIFIFAHLYPLFCTWFLIYYGGYCKRESNYYLIDKNSTPKGINSPFTRSSFYQLIVSAFHGFTATPMNICILWTLLNRKKNHQKLTVNRGKKTRDAQINLSVFTIVLFLIAGVTIGCQAYYFFHSNSMSNEEIRYLINLQVYALDLYVYTAPWLLFLLSNSMRKELKRMFKSQSNIFSHQINHNVIKQIKK